MRLLRTYTAFAYVCIRLFCTLCRFCVHIRLIVCASCAAFAYVYGFLCALSGFFVRIRIFLRVELIFDSLKVLMIWYLGFFDLLKVLMIWSWGFFNLLIVSMIQYWGLFFRRSARYDWTICRIQSSGFRRVLYPEIFTRFIVRSYLIEFLSNNLLAIHCHW